MCTQQWKSCSYKNGQGPLAPQKLGGRHGADARSPSAPERTPHLADTLILDSSHLNGESLHLYHFRALGNVHPKNQYISLIHPPPSQATRSAGEVSKGQGKSRPAPFLVTLSAKIKLPSEWLLFSVSLFWLLAIIFKSSPTQKPEIHIYFSEIGSPLFHTTGSG